MDLSRFDDLTKALATSTSRRQALKTITATTIGSILGLAGIGTAFAAKNCKQLGQGCNTKKNLCCPGLICQGGVCVAPTTTTTSTTTTSTTTTSTTTTSTTTLPPPVCSSGGDFCDFAVTCGSYGGGYMCYCATDIDGSNVCSVASRSAHCAICTSDADCGAGWVCILAPTCCLNNGGGSQGTFCAPRC